MKRLIAVAAALVMLASTAQAQTITRYGKDYNGYANPGNCEIFVHTDGRDPNALHVDCVEADAKARVRWRFLRDVGGKFEPADVEVDLKINGGKNCNESRVRWMVPVPRTVRVVIPVGCYVHIRSITWTQS